MIWPRRFEIATRFRMSRTAAFWAYHFAYADQFHRPGSRWSSWG